MQRQRKQLNVIIFFGTLGIRTRDGWLKCLNGHCLLFRLIVIIMRLMQNLFCIILKGSWVRKEFGNFLLQIALCYCIVHICMM